MMFSGSEIAVVIKTDFLPNLFIYFSYSLEIDECLRFAAANKGGIENVIL